MNHFASKTAHYATTENIAATRPTNANITTSATEIHDQLKVVVQSERKITQQILDLINQCELTRCFAKLGYSSMFEYLHKGLGYSEGSAQRRLSSARLLREMPEIKVDLQKGDLNLTQVSMAQIAIRHEEKTQSKKMSLARKKEIIEKLKTKNAYESKAVLANELSSFSDQGRDSITPLKEDRVQITITLSRAEFEQIKEAQDHLSNSVKSSEIKDYLLYVTSRVLQSKRIVHRKKSLPEKRALSESKSLTPKKDLEKKKLTAATAVARPTRVAQTTASGNQNGSANASQTANRKANANTSQRLRPFMKQSLRKHVLQNANFQCQYVSKETQKRCAATRFLQIDHIQPVAFHGPTNKENLRVFCQAHNHLAAINSGLVNPLHGQGSELADIGQ